MKKGFTIIEALIVVVIIGILAAITVVTIRGITSGDIEPATEEKQCEWYKDTAYKNLPAKCLKYYDGGK